MNVKRLTEAVANEAFASNEGLASSNELPTDGVLAANAVDSAAASPRSRVVF